MCNIETYVFFDIETTGLPWQENNRTKITELCFVAALRKDVIVTPPGSLPPVSKLTLLFNPGRQIHPEAVKLNGLSNELLRNAPLFNLKIDTVVSFLNELPKPVCLVAHNGNRFDFKILLTEFCDASMSLPDDLLCVDSLVGFRQILNSKNVNEVNVTKPLRTASINSEDLLTDDEDEWPDLNLSTDEWKDIDEICESLSDISCEDLSEITKDCVEKKIGKKHINRTAAIERVFRKNKNNNKGCYTLISVYKQLLKKDPLYNHHRAEDDCYMLLECVVEVKNEFIHWSNSVCKRLSEIKPLIRQ